MKKIIALLTVIIIVFSAMSFSVSAAVPTELTITETKTAPNINDGGVIDEAYGAKLFDMKGSDHPLESQNLYPNKTREPHLLEEQPVKDAIAAMRNVGYMTYDKENLYIACEVTDIAPKAASNSSEYWKSTNLQLVIFLNQELNFPTIAYEGKNKVKVWGDERSVLDYEMVEATFTEKSQTNYVYEIKIPWEAFPDVKSSNDVEEIKMGIVQSSMANGYVCSAFGEAYHLKYDKCIPVTMAKASGSSDKKPASSNQATTSDKKEEASSNNNTAASENNNTASKDTDKNTASKNDKNNTSSKDKNTASDKANSSVNAPTTGTEIVTESTDSTASQSTENQEGSTTVITEEAEKDWTPIIIIGIVAVVIIAGGAVAIIMMNKKS